MTSKKVALIETKPTSTNYQDYFDNAFKFDLYHLCSDPSIKKVLKRDCDINIDTDAYDFIILVGSEALKYFTKATAVMTYSGRLVDGKYLPIINPAMLAFKPEAKTLWESSKDNIINYIAGSKKEAKIDDTIAIGINNTKEINKFLTQAINHGTPYFSYDSETTGLYPRDGYIQGISICYDGKKGAYLSLDAFDGESETLLETLFKEKLPIFHNAKFDVAFLEYNFDIKVLNFEDTMLLHYLIDENPGTHGLKDLAAKYTPYGDYEKPLREWMEQFRKEHGIRVGDFMWEWIPFEVMYPYAAMDALCTFLLYEKFVKIKQNKRLKDVYDNILIPGCRFLTNIQDNGVPFDLNRLHKAQALMQAEIDEDIEALYKHEEIKQFETYQGKEFNPNSVVQLRVLLFDFLKLQPTGIKTGTGQHSTNAEVLNKLAEVSEVPKLILDIRQKSKIKNTYLDKIIPQIDSDGKLRTNFNLHSTTSGRLSSSGKLNMQQLPRDNPIVKGCIMAPPGYKIVAMDLKTAEIYGAAVLSGDEALMDVFRQGGDFHSAIAKKVFNLDCPVEEVKSLYPGLRQAAKAVSFGIMYGAGPAKISEQVTKDSGTYFSIQEATEVINDYFRAFNRLKKWIETNQAFIESNGFIYSHFGRKRRLPNVKSKDKGIKSHSIRSGLNFLVQSVASDINLLGAIDLEADIRANNKKSSIFALVHDSVLALVPEEELEWYQNKLREHIQKDRGLSIPGCPIGIDIEVGQDYSMGKFEEKYDVLL